MYSLNDKMIKINPQCKILCYPSIKDTIYFFNLEKNVGYMNPGDKHNFDQL